MKEVVILSGKGGTGKTSLTAAFAHLAGCTVLTDCDVDAADLHLVVAPEATEAFDFRAGAIAKVTPSWCQACGRCHELCRFGAIDRPAQQGLAYAVDAAACEGCAVCARFCPHGAIEMEPSVCGQWFRSRTRYGPMLHAQLGVGAENSGKLVTVLRREARNLAEMQRCHVLLTDGPPGIGCPVIASLSGADHAVYVTEPTVSGLHDLRRVAELAAGFHVAGSVVINKADINSEQAQAIIEWARAHGLPVLGDIPYDMAFTRAQLAGSSVLEGDPGPASNSVRAIWDRLQAVLASQPRHIPVSAQATSV